MDKINEQMYRANIDLVDKNRLLEEDKKILQKRINRAIELYENDDYMQLADDMYKILKGRYLNNE